MPFGDDKTEPQNAQPLLSGHTVIAINEDNTISDETLFNDLYTRIDLAKQNAKKNPNQTPPATPKHVLVITGIATGVLLAGRALSCTYRYVTTEDALQLLFREPFIHQSGKQWTKIITESGAILFFLTDTFVTLVSTKDSVKSLCNIRQSLQHKLSILRDDNGKLPVFQLLILLALMPGGMLGAFYKGKVGVPTLVSHIGSLSSNDPAEWIGSVATGFGYFAGVSSALCYLAFQSEQALELMHIARSVKRSPYYPDFEAKHKWMIRMNMLITFVVSLSASLVSVAAKFYSNGNLDIDAQTLVEISAIAFSSTVLSIFFTTGPKYLYTTIEEWCKQKNAQQQTVVWIVMLGLISSTGTCLATFPSIVDMFLLATQKKTLAEEGLSYQIAGIICTVLLSIPLFPRDYAYYTKKVLELWNVRFPTTNTENTTPGCTVRVSNCASSFVNGLSLCGQRIKSIVSCSSDSDAILNADVSPTLTV